MRGRLGFVSAVCLSMLLVTGCWDRKELNERALWSATGLDVDDHNQFKVSGQVIIAAKLKSPSSGSGGGGGGGGQGKPFIITSESGRNMGEALQKVKADISREPFFGQRRVIFFGEEFAKRGLINRLDSATRGADVALRTDMFVVKTRTAEEALSIPSSLETVPSFAALKKHLVVGGRADTMLLDFLIAANSDGIRPTLPVIEIFEPQEKNRERYLRFAGAAVFDQDLKLAGYISTKEDLDLLWIFGRLPSRTISISTSTGNASLTVKQLKGKIVPSMKGTDIRFKVVLRGNGMLYETNSSLSAISSKDLAALQRQFEKEAERLAMHTIRSVQEKYGLDIFGFGEALHRKHPRRWQAVKKDWDYRFSKADISVEAHLPIKQTGLTVSSLWFHEGGKE